MQMIVDRNNANDKFVRIQPATTDWWRAFFFCENLTDSLDGHARLWTHATGGGEHQWIKVSVFNVDYSVMIFSVFSLLVLSKKGLQGFGRVMLHKKR